MFFKCIRSSQPSDELEYGKEVLNSTLWTMDFFSSVSPDSFNGPLQSQSDRRLFAGAASTGAGDSLRLSDLFDNRALFTVLIFVCAYCKDDKYLMIQSEFWIQGCRCWRRRRWHVMLLNVTWRRRWHVEQLLLPGKCRGITHSCIILCSKNDSVTLKHFPQSWVLQHTATHSSQWRWKTLAAWFGSFYVKPVCSLLVCLPYDDRGDSFVLLLVVFIMSLPSYILLPSGPY